MADQPKGIALTIGVNRVDPRFYVGAPDLAGCVNDADDIAEIARSRHFAVMPSLTNERATAHALESALEEAASRLDPGDLFLLHYSGHGMDNRSFDLRGDRNTSWCLFDGPYLDDKLFDSWFRFKPGVRIVVLSDSCHSGTAVREVLRERAMQASSRGRSLDEPFSREDMIPRGLSPAVLEATVRQNEDFFRQVGRDAKDLRRRNESRVPPVAVVLLSGCKDEETSGDLAANGIFTGALKKVWDRGNFQGDYDSLLAAIVREVQRRSSRQTPQLFPIGEPMLAGNLVASPPFRI